MRAGIATRLDRLNRRLPPTWLNLARLIPLAGERMNHAELDACTAHVLGRATAEQEALWKEWYKRNLPRVWAVWDERYPGWKDAPFWPKPADDDGDEWP